MWQGIIYHNWPYTKIPLKISKEMPKPGYVQEMDVQLGERVWKYLKGQDDFFGCLNQNNDIQKFWKNQNCTPIFHPYSYKAEPR